MLLSEHFAATSIQEILTLLREHLGMDVAFVGEFTGTHRVFRHISTAPDADVTLHLGDGHANAETYCHRIVTGVLDPVIPDAASHPIAQQIPATAALNVRAHIGTPIVFRDGYVYGSLCSFSQTADPSLGARDLKFLQLMAAVIADRLYPEHVAHVARAHRRGAIENALSGGDPNMVFQPIMSLNDRTVAGYEALARFAAEPRRTPDVWFADARELGLSEMLEVRAITLALAAQRQLGDVFIAVNVSPAVLHTRALDEVLASADCTRVVLEITEQDAGVATNWHYSIDHLRCDGVRVALDDLGAGYSGLRRLLEIAPDIVKMDLDMTRGVATDVARQALVASAVSFSQSVGTMLIAEGIEFAEDLRILRELGVEYGQGYLLGRPAPRPETVSRAS
jgi:EAL domain-containing protein (putative c-di-GMP-specific phosphodiesterase class I)